MSEAKGTPEQPHQSCVNIMLKLLICLKQVVNLGTVLMKPYLLVLECASNSSRCIRTVVCRVDFIELRTS